MTESLSVCKHWTVQSKKNMAEDQHLINTLFQLLVESESASPRLFKMVINVIRKMLGHCSSSKLLLNQRFSVAVKPESIPPLELSFVQSTVDYLYAHKAKYSEALSLGLLDADEDPRAEYARKYTQLLLAVSHNFEIVFASRQELAGKLVELLLEGSKSKNLNTAVQIVEFWADLKQSLLEAIRCEVDRENNRITVSSILQQIEGTVPLS